MLNELNLAERLGHIDLFERADPATLEELAKRCHTLQAAPGTTIFDQQDDGRELFAILEGKVRVTLLSPRGQEVSFRDQPAGTAFGLLSAVDGRPRSASIVAVDRSRIAAIDAAALKAAMASSPPVMDAVLAHLALLVRQLSERVFEFSTLVARHRVQAELLRLAREGERMADGSAVIRPAPTHASIATRISTQRETVSREISVLARMGLIKRISGGLVVRDLEGLAEMVEHAREGDL